MSDGKATPRKGPGAGSFSETASSSKDPGPSPDSDPSHGSASSPDPVRPPGSGPPSSSDSPPNGGEEERVERDFGELLADVERERDEYLELARRTKADFENYRKRVAGEAAQAQKRGQAELARELLPVLDNLERALAAAEQGTTARQAGDETLAEGVRLVREELENVLRRSGVESYEPAGEPFDPHCHEAMMTRPAGTEDAGKVLEVLEKGYRLDGQVLRPARVVVGAEESGPSGGEPSNGSENQPSGGAPADGSQVG